jgi:hypothetical protein
MKATIRLAGPKTSDAPWHRTQREGPLFVGQAAANAGNFTAALRD